MELGGKSPHLVFESANLEEGNLTFPFPIVAMASSSRGAWLSRNRWYIFDKEANTDATCPHIVDKFEAHAFPLKYDRFSFLLDISFFLPSATNWAALGICYNSGQDCTAGSRLYVQDSIYDKFLEILVAKVNAHVIGDGLDENTDGGPLVRRFVFHMLTRVT